MLAAAENKMADLRFAKVVGRPTHLGKRTYCEALKTKTKIKKFR